MFFSKLIQEIQNDVPVILSNITDDREVKDVSLLEPGQTRFQTGVLYYGYEEQWLKSPRPEMIVSAGEDQHQGPCAAVCHARIRREDLFCAFNASRRILQEESRESLYEDMRRMYENGRSIQAVMDAAARRLGNALVLVDRDYRVLAYSPSTPMPDEKWRKNIKQGFCSYDFVLAVRDQGIHLREEDAFGVLDATSSESRYRKYCFPIYVRNAYVGFLLMVTGETADSGRSSLTQTQFYQLGEAGRAMAYIISNAEPQLLQNQSAYQTLLRDMLIGATSSELYSRIQTLQFPPVMVTLCVEPRQYLSQGYPKTKYARQLKELLPGSHVTYHESRIALLCPEEVFADRRERLEGFCAAEDTRMGVSNSFTDVALFSARYAQAYNALQIGSRLDSGRFVFEYQKYQIYDLLKHCGDSQELRFFCHDALERLRRYDLENDAALYRTLRVYLDCGKSIKLAAERMFIHRNSMVYRLEKIARIGKIDLDDPETCLLLQISFRIDDI